MESPAPATPEGGSSPAAPPTGWVPQGSGGGGSGAGSAPIQRGSSLGSGGGSSVSGSTGKEPSYAPSDSSGYYEAAAPAPSTPTVEETTSAPSAESEVDSVEPTVAEPAPRKPQADPPSAASAPAQPEKQGVAGVHATSPLKTATLASQSEPAGSGPNVFWWLAVIACGLVMLYAAARLLFEPTELFKRRPKQSRPS